MFLVLLSVALSLAHAEGTPSISSKPNSEGVARKVKFFPDLQCEAVRCLEGTDCDLAPFEIRDLSSSQGAYIFTPSDDLPPDWNPSHADRARIEFEGLHVIFNFSNGDQDRTYTFPKSELYRLRTTISGEYYDGFAWANGDGVRARIKLSCTPLR